MYNAPTAGECADEGKGMGSEKPAAGDPHEPRAAVMSLGEHLDELRVRVIRCLLVVAGAFMLCWFLRDRLRVIVLRPHVRAMQALDLDTVLNFSSHFETLVAQIKACGLIAAVLASPVILYQIWAFVAPGLFPHERRRSMRLAVACMVCLAAGIVFGYFVFVPTALRYLVSLSGGWAKPVLMISSYLSLLFLLTLALAVAFQTPVIIYYLVRWGVVTPAALRRHRKGVILGAFVVGAFFTPPDPVTQIMMALTLIILYDLGGLVAAPTWSSFRSFFGFTGGILLAGLAFAGWFHFSPVGRVEAVRGAVFVGGRSVAGPGDVGVRRGEVCRTGADGLARVRLGGADGPVIYLTAQGRLQVHGPADLSLYAGRCLLDCKGEEREVSVRSAPGTALAVGARAEFLVPDSDTVTVTVFSGVVRVSAGGQDRRIAAGQSATFRRGGEPADLTAAEQRWQALIEGRKEGGEPAAK